MKALEIVLQKLLEDPHHDSVPSVNYSNERNSSIHSYNQQLNINHIQSFNDRMFSYYIQKQFIYSFN
jgi:hypothetical protein